MIYILLRDIPIAILAAWAYLVVILLEAWVETEHGAIEHFGYYAVIVALFTALLVNHRPIFANVKGKILMNSLNVLLSAFGTVSIWMIGRWMYATFMAPHSQ